MGITNYKVYTPYEYAEFMCELVLENYFEKEYTKEKLDRIRIADLSCGTGNLLLVIIEKLIKLSQEITGVCYFNSEWVSGYDIDEKAFEEYVAKGRELLERYGVQGEILGYVADSLLDDNSLGKYNVVIGNPPYIGEKNHKELFDKMKETEFGRRYYEGKMDYLYYFIEKGADVLADNGVMVYVTTNYWLKADSAVKLRNKLREEGEYTHIIDYNTSIFKNALGQHNLVFSWRKRERKKDNSIFVTHEDEKFSIKNSHIYDETGNIILVSDENRDFNKKIISKSNYKLDDIMNINQGIVTGCDKVFISETYDETFKNYMKPFYKNKDIFKYSCKKENDFWIYYIENGEDIPQELKDKFSPFHEKLIKRREAALGRRKWYELSWGREKSIMTGEKILARQRCKTNYFAYDNGDFFGSADIYYLTLKDKENKKDKSFNIFYILGYLNSEIFYLWYKNNGKCKGYNLEFYTTPLKQVPVYYPEDNTEKTKQEINYIEILVKKQINNYSDEIQEEINKYFRDIFL